MATSVTYTATGSTAQFSITFPFASTDHIEVYLNDVLKTTRVIDTVNSTVTITDVNGDPESPANGTTVVIQRVTDVTQPVTVFSDGAVYIADGLNNQVNQLLYAIEEVSDRVDTVAAGGGGGGGGGTVPVANATNQFLVSGAGPSYDWQVKTLAQTKSVLGVDGTMLPAAVADRLLVTQAGAATYELQSPATVKTRLGINADVPAIQNRQNHIMMSNSNGTAYTLNSTDTTRTMMGLGTAATRNTGTAAGQIPLLVTPAAGAVGALPVISGENLTNVLKTFKSALFLRRQTTSLLPAAPRVVSNTGWTELTDQYTSLSTSYSAAIAADPWASAVGSGSGGINLTSAGTYIVRCEQMFTRTANSPSVKMRLAIDNFYTVIGAAEDPDTDAADWTETATEYFTSTAGPSLTRTVSGQWMFTTNQAAVIKIQAKASLASSINANDATYSASDPEAIVMRVHITKIG